MAEVLSPTNSPHGGRSPYLSSTPTSDKPVRPIHIDSSNLPSSKHSYYHDSDAEDVSESSSEPYSPPVDKDSADSTPPSSVLDHQEEDEELFFPTYDDNDTVSPGQDAQCDPPASPSPLEAVPDLIRRSPIPKPADDSAVYDSPSRHVDYLSHDWREEDIWHSWRHIITNRKTFGERSRLENASWRTWTKAKFQLRTVPPGRLNWEKDCDVTWLYGPLQEARPKGRRPTLTHTALSYSEPTSRLFKNDSFLTKPILKKRSVSEVMLQKSLSTSSLIKEAAAVVQAQRSSSRRSTSSRSRPGLSRSASMGAGLIPTSCETAGPPSLLSSQSVSELHSPANGKRHIRFDDTVEQCRAVDFEHIAQADISYDSLGHVESSSSEDELVMMKQPSRRQSSGRNSRRESFGQESKGIVMLPSTRLKYHHDQPNCPGHLDSSDSNGRLRHSSSQETLRPSRPSANFLLDEDEDDLSWEPSGAFDTPRPGSAAGIQCDSADEAPDGLRRTSSGMFMPLEEDDADQTYGSNGVFGRVVDTVNTARDIFSVIVNVGWRS